MNSGFSSKLGTRSTIAIAIAIAIAMTITNAIAIAMTIAIAIAMTMTTTIPYHLAQRQVPDMYIHIYMYV